MALPDTAVTQRRPVETLLPAALNARTHDEAQIDQLVRSIHEFGFTAPVLVDEAGEIIAGHGRVLAAKKAGLADVPVIVAVGWSEAQRRAYRIADNKLALNAGWDLDSLRVEMNAVFELGFDGTLTGFTADELADLVAPAEPKEPELRAPSINYNVVFDDAAQQEQWFALIRQLKQTYPGDTVGAALVAFIAAE